MTLTPTSHSTSNDSVEDIYQSTIRYQSFGFDGSISCQDFEAQVCSTLVAVQRGLSQLECLVEKPTRENFLLPLDHLCLMLGNRSGACEIFQYLHPDLKMRASIESLSDQLDKIKISMQQSSRLAALMLAVDRSNLDRLDERFIDRWTKDFARCGTYLSPDDRETFKQMMGSEGVLSRKYNHNMIEGQKSMTVALDRLKGMSDEFMASHPPDGEGQVRLTTKDQDRMQILDYCEDDDVRRDMSYLQNTVGFPANEPVLKELLDVRQRLANILGYKSWSHYILEIEMISTPDNAMALVEELYQGTKAAVQNRLSELEEILGTDRPLEMWQMEYAKQLFAKQKFGGFSPQDARQYFRVSKVIPGLLQFAEGFYSIKLEKRLDVKTWHPTVLVFDVYDRHNSTALMGRIYLDYLFRGDKRNHPSTLGLTAGVDGKQYAEAVLVLGLEAEMDATMSYWDVSACWHELGHLFHHILGGKEQRYHCFSGFNGVAYDFIEAPSQLAEEWLKIPEVVQRFAVNKGGETISDAMLESLIKSEEIVNVLLTCQRLLWTRIALMYHAEITPEKTLEAVWKEVEALYGCFPRFPAGVLYRPELGWIHLAAYGPRYVGYQNSLAISKELKGAWESSGMMNQNTTRKFRQKVLERGSSVDAAEMIRDFLGRPHTTSAYLKYLNEQV